MFTVSFSEKELKFIIFLLSMMEHLPSKVLDPERKDWIVYLRMKFQNAIEEAGCEEVHYDESETD